MNKNKMLLAEERIGGDKECRKEGEQQQRMSWGSNSAVWK